MKKVRYSTLWLTYTGVLIALQIVLGNLVQVALLEKQMNLGFLPIAAAGYLFGPVSAMIVAALGDVLGTLILRYGRILPGLHAHGAYRGLPVWGDASIRATRSGLLQGAQEPLRAGHRPARALMAAALAAVTYIFLNSYWITFIRAQGLPGCILLGRLPFNLAEIPIFTVHYHHHVRGAGSTACPPCCTHLRNAGQVPDGRWTRESKRLTAHETKRKDPPWRPKPKSRCSRRWRQLYPPMRRPELNFKDPV